MEVSDKWSICYQNYQRQFYPIFSQNEAGRRKAILVVGCNTAIPKKRRAKKAEDSEKPSAWRFAEQNRDRLVSSAISTTGSSTAAAAETAAATGTGFFRTRFVHLQGSVADARSIQSGNRGIRLVIVHHFDETETLRATGFAIGDDIHRIHGSMLFEFFAEIVLSCPVSQVTNVNLHLSLFLPPGNKNKSDLFTQAAGRKNPRYRKRGGIIQRSEQ